MDILKFFEGSWIVSYQIVIYLVLIALFFLASLKFTPSVKIGENKLKFVFVTSVYLLSMWTMTVAFSAVTTLFHLGVGYEGLFLGTGVGLIFYSFTIIYYHVLNSLYKPKSLTIG